MPKWISVGAGDYWELNEATSLEEVARHLGDGTPFNVDLANGGKMFIDGKVVGAVAYGEVATAERSKMRMRGTA